MSTKFGTIIFRHNFALCFLTNETTILKLEIVLSACMIDINLHLSHFKHWLLAHCRRKYEYVESTFRMFLAKHTEMILE